MDVLQEDVKTLDEDIQNIKCSPIIKFFKDFFKCLIDFLNLFKKNY